MELEQRCCQITFPLIVGGDFNLIRKETDKSSGQGNKLLMKCSILLLKNANSERLKEWDPDILGQISKTIKFSVILTGFL